MRLKDRTALVFGAGSYAPGWSNGKAVAVSYARSGARVAVVDRYRERAEETAAIIRGEGGEALPLSADATSPDAVEAAVAATLAEWGSLDILHNNVGVGGASGSVLDISPEAWDQEFAVNTKSAFLGMHFALPHMIQRGGGVVTNTSSLLAARYLRRPNVAYSAAKAAVEALTQASAWAHARDNVRVNCIRIGFSETPLIVAPLTDRRGLSPEEAQVELDKSRAKVPLRGEHTQPWDIAEAAVFLASDAARHITGVILPVDGGLMVAPI